MKKYDNFLVGLGVLFVVVGFVTLHLFFTVSPPTLTVLPVQAKGLQKRTESTAQPIQLTVPSVGIDLGIVPGYYDVVRQYWTSDNSHAVYASMTPLPGSVHGTTLIYAHDQPALFRPLFGVQKGDKVLVATSDGKTYQYVFTHAVDVLPTDTSVLSPSPEARLVLQTCSGRFYQNRRLFFFSYKGVA